jgi:hypothetical protein
MVDGIIMVDGITKGGTVVGEEVPILASTSARVTPPTDTTGILNTVITDTLRTGTTTNTRTE